MAQKKASKAKTPQAKRFIEKARELGCDENEAAFDERLRKIVKAQLTNVEKPKTNAKRAKD